MKAEGFTVEKHRFGDKTWSAVIGISTKEPYVYEDVEKELNDKWIEKDADHSNVPLVPDVPRILYNPLRERVSEIRGTSGTSGTEQKVVSDENVFNLSEPDANTKLQQSLINASQQFEREHGEINSGNAASFSFWYCDKFKPRWVHGNKSGSYTPIMILPIARKLFKITPAITTPATTITNMKHHRTEAFIKN